MTKDEVIKMFKGPGCYSICYDGEEVQFNPTTKEDWIDLFELWNNDELGYGKHTFDEIKSIKLVYIVEDFGSCYISVRYKDECYLIIDSAWNNECMTVAMSNYEITYKYYEEGPYKCILH